MMLQCVYVCVHVQKYGIPGAVEFLHTWMVDDWRCAGGGGLRPWLGDVPNHTHPQMVGLQ